MTADIKNLYPGRFAGERNQVAAIDGASPFTVEAVRAAYAAAFNRGMGEAGQSIYTNYVGNGRADTALVSQQADRLAFERQSSRRDLIIDAERDGAGRIRFDLPADVLPFDSVTLSTEYDEDDLVITFRWNAPGFSPQFLGGQLRRFSNFFLPVPDEARRRGEFTDTHLLQSARALFDEDRRLFFGRFLVLDDRVLIYDSADPVSAIITPIA